MDDDDGLTGLAALGRAAEPVESADPQPHAVEVGARIAAARAARGLKGTELAALVGLRKDQISKIESGRRRVDISELPRVATALGVTVRHLLGQADRPMLELAARLAMDAAPVALRPARRRARQILELDDLLTQVAGMPAARTSEAGGRVVDYGRGRFTTAPRNKTQAREHGKRLAEFARRELDLGSDALSDLAALIEQHFAVDVALSPLGTEADGLCVHSGPVALILASSDFPDGHLRFTLAHELGHHLFGDPREVIEEGESDMFVDGAAECRANAFAGHLLLPGRGVATMLDWLGAPARQVTDRTAVALMEHFGVSLAALVFQLNLLGLLDYDEGQQLRARGVGNLLSRHRDVAPTGAATVSHHVVRPPERLTRYALAAARERRLGLSVVASLLGRDDDDELWADVMGDAANTATGELPI